MESVSGGVKSDKALTLRDRFQQSLLARWGHGRRAVRRRARQIPRSIESDGIIAAEVAFENSPVIRTIHVEPAEPTHLDHALLGNAALSAATLPHRVFASRARMPAIDPGMTVYAASDAEQSSWRPSRACWSSPVSFPAEEPVSSPAAAGRDSSARLPDEQTKDVFRVSRHKSTPEGSGNKLHTAPRLQVTRAVCRANRTCGGPDLSVQRIPCLLTGGHPPVNSPTLGQFGFRQGRAFIRHNMAEVVGRAALPCCHVCQSIPQQRMCGTESHRRRT
jgi:hypothetical protein